jgi:hypothetical protein
MRLYSTVAIFFNLHSGGVESRSTRHCGHLMAYCVSPGWLWANGEIGGMIGRGNRSTRRKPAPVLLCPPQTPHAARTRTRAAAVGSQRLTAELRHGHSGNSSDLFLPGTLSNIFVNTDCSNWSFHGYLSPPPNEEFKNSISKWANLGITVQLFLFHC